MVLLSVGRTTSNAMSAPTGSDSPCTITHSPSSVRKLPHYRVPSSYQESTSAQEKECRFINAAKKACAPRLDQCPSRMCHPAMDCCVSRAGNQEQCFCRACSKWSIADAALAKGIALSTAWVLLEMQPSAACGAQIPLMKALIQRPPKHDQQGPTEALAGTNHERAHRGYRYGQSFPSAARRSIDRCRHDDALHAEQLAQPFVWNTQVQERQLNTAYLRKLALTKPSRSLTPYIGFRAFTLQADGCSVVHGTRLSSQLFTTQVKTVELSPTRSSRG